MAVFYKPIHKLTSVTVIAWRKSCIFFVGVFRKFIPNCIWGTGWYHLSLSWSKLSMNPPCELSVCCISQSAGMILHSIWYSIERKSKFMNMDSNKLIVVHSCTHESITCTMTRLVSLKVHRKWKTWTELPSIGKLANPHFLPLFECMATFVSHVH